MSFRYIATCVAFSHHKTSATSELIVNNNDYNTSVSCGEEITNIDVIIIFLCEDHEDVEVSTSLHSIFLYMQGYVLLIDKRT